MRPCDGLSPTRPQHDAGILVDPAPSVACAIGTMPAATAAADPPLDPPGEWVWRHGLRAGPQARGSETGRLPNSEQFVRPAMTRPAARKRETSVVSAADGIDASFRRLFPPASGAPSYAAIRSLRRNGTPRNTPAGRSPEAVARARSNHFITTALRPGSSSSIRSIAASSSSHALTCPDLTNAA
jgi:hypothetical protein